MASRLAGAIALVLLVASHGLAQAQNERTAGGADVVTTASSLVYPSIAASAAVQGVVVARGVLDDSGKPSDLVVLSGNKLLAPDALASVKAWTFKRNNAGSFVVVVDFRLEGACHSGGQTQVRLASANVVRVTSCGLANW